MPRKSHIVGPATDSAGMRTTAYRACVPLVCVQCARAILPDSLFSRRSQRTTWATMGAGTTTPVCMTCRPLHMDGITDAPSPANEVHHDG